MAIIGMGKAFEVIARLAEVRGLIRPRDLEAAGLSRAWLELATFMGYVNHVGPALYSHPDLKYPLELRVLARAPRAVLCLRTALFLHGLSPQPPEEVWLAIHHKARVPTRLGALVRVVRCSGPAWNWGVVQQNVHGFEGRFTSVARTISDCFKHRDKVGRQTAERALAQGLEQKLCRPEELVEAARILRVTGRVLPLLRGLRRPPESR